MLEIINYILQTFMSIGAFYVSYLIFNRDKKYIGNKLLSSALGLLGGYSLFLLIYKLINQEWALQIFLRISFVSVTFSVFFLYLTIQVLTHSQQWLFTYKLRWAIPIILAAAISILLISTDWIHVENNDLVNMDYSDLQFIIFALYIAIMLVYSIMRLYTGGVKKTEGNSKKRMQIFLTGLIFALLGLVMEALNSLFKGYGELFDLLLFSCLTTANAFMSLTFLLKNLADT